MATRSNIAIRLHEEDRNKDFYTPWGEKVNANGAEYLYVYCHWDGYPEGVGADLMERFTGATYKEMLEFILDGDRSTVDTSYWAWRQEECAPEPMPTPVVHEEFLYLLTDVHGEGEVFLWNEDDEEWELMD